MSDKTVKEVATIRDFSGMTAEEISKYIDENGLRGDDLADINAELEEEEAREEANAPPVLFPFFFPGNRYP